MPPHSSQRKPPQHRRNTSLPPPTPQPWLWSCHRCFSLYRFSAARNRCLACSHRFCRKCISQIDYEGWDVWNAYWSPSSNSPPIATPTLATWSTPTSWSPISTRAGFWRRDAPSEEGDCDVSWLALCLSTGDFGESEAAETPMDTDRDASRGVPEAQPQPVLLFSSLHHPFNDSAKDDDLAMLSLGLEELRMEISTLQHDFAQSSLLDPSVRVPSDSTSSDFPPPSPRLRHAVLRPPPGLPPPCRPQSNVNEGELMMKERLGKPTLEKHVGPWWKSGFIVKSSVAV